MSPKGAFGLGQLMPETARALGVDRRDIAQNLDGAARYLLAQLDRFRDIDLALAAYNAGPHRVTEYGGVPPFAETRTYIARIHHLRARLSGHQPSISTENVSEPPGRTAVVLGLN
jgi:soluble lytic murein transglycosylase-like protein